MENNMVEYKDFKFGRALKIIAIILEVITIVMIIATAILTFKIIGLLPIVILVFIFKPLIKLHENTILFINANMSKPKYKKKRVYALINSIIIGAFFGFVFGVSFGIIGVLLAVIMVLPYWIFLSKTNDLLSQEKEITIENKVEENEKKIL